MTIRREGVHQYQIGLTASYIALTLGGFYFIYALKYYLSSLLALVLFSIDPEKCQSKPSIQRTLALRNNEEISIGEEPWISIHLPFYN